MLICECLHVFGKGIGLNLDGSNRCQGRLEIRPSSSVEFGQACDNDVSRNEARVICRQLNCGTEGASVVSATKYVWLLFINKSVLSAPSYIIIFIMCMYAPSFACRFRSAASINVYRGFGYVCSSGNETSITSCRRTGSSCSTVMASNFIGIECKILYTCQVYIIMIAWGSQL